jgi:hypothetical protein
VRFLKAKATPAADVAVAAFMTLAPTEQEEAFAKINDRRLERLSDADSEFGAHLRSLLKVAEAVEEELTPDSYKAARRRLLAEGEEVFEFNAVCRFFGSWRRAKEALGLSDVTTAQKIEARFRSRLVGRPFRYRDETLKEILLRCARDIGHAPLVVEFEHWRYRELELAAARDEQLHLPSASPYRRRFGTWEKALLAYGFSEAEVKARFEPGRERSQQALAERSVRFGSAER